MLIIDTPELFWSEASLFPLYEAIREYLEIGPRVQVLNDRLAVAGDLVCLRCLGLSMKGDPVPQSTVSSLAAGYLLITARNHSRIYRRERNTQIDLDCDLVDRSGLSRGDGECRAAVPPQPFHLPVVLACAAI